MKSNKMVSSFYKIYNMIITTLFLFIAFFKVVKVYEKIRFAEFSPIYATLTLMVIGSFYLIIKRFSSKLANIFAIIFYSISSVILFIDCAYFSYMNKFTSIANLELLSFLDSVSSSLKQINPLKFIWILFDIPIILIYSIFIHKKLYIFLSKKINVNFNLKNISIAKKMVTLVGIIIFVGYSALTNFKLKYIRTENIIYHVRDFINVTFDFNKDINFEEYFKIKEVRKDENYGIANGKNVVIIQVEALQNFVINKEYNGKEITPFLNSLTNNESFYFNNYFYQVGAGNTSDAEFTVNNSLLSTTTDAAYVKYHNNEYYGLPHILKENGYIATNAYHAYNREFWNREIAYLNQGFDNYYASGDYVSDEIIGMGLSDESFLKQVSAKMSALNEPFYSFIITLSSHHPFEIDEKYCDINLKKEHIDTLFGNYLKSINYFDKALETFMNELKENEIYKDSIFVIYGDHFGLANYNHPDASFAGEMIGYEYSYKDMMNVPLIIHIPGMEKTEKIEKVMGHVDVLPTLLHLLGLENNKGIMMGQDIFSIEENVVYEMMHVGEGSFITNDTFYYSSISGIDVFNKAYDIKTGKEIAITNEMLKESEKAKEFIKNARSLLNENKVIRDSAKNL